MYKKRLEIFLKFFVFSENTEEKILLRYFVILRWKKEPNKSSFPFPLTHAKQEGARGTNPEETLINAWRPLCHLMKKGLKLPHWLRGTPIGNRGAPVGQITVSRNVGATWPCRVYRSLPYSCSSPWEWGEFSLRPGMQMRLVWGSPSTWMRPLFSPTLTPAGMKWGPNCSSQ